MRKWHSLVGSLLFTAACSQGASTVAPSLSGSSPAIENLAFPFTRNSVVPFEREVFVPCADSGQGESVVLTGELHVLKQFVPNAEGVHQIEHYQWKNVSAVGANTGDTYKGISNESYDLIVDVDTSHFVNKLEITMLLIGQGTASTFRVRSVLHTTIVDGEDRVRFQESWVDCSA